jgi:hypothetical protein
VLVGGSARMKLDDEVMKLEQVRRDLRVVPADARIRGGSRGSLVHSLRGVQHREARCRTGVAELVDGLTYC